MIAFTKQNKRQGIILATCVFVGMLSVLLFPSSTVEAASIVWNERIKQNLCARSVFANKQFCSNVFKNLNVSISYRYEVKNLSTGKRIRCGGSPVRIPLGTKIKITLHPEARRDISWSGTGTIYDTPYGYWSNNAKELSKVSCESADLIKRRKYKSDKATIYAYTPLFVDPVARRVTGDGKRVSCGSQNRNGAQVCEAKSEGRQNLQIVFGKTQGKFYHQYKASNNAYAAWGLTKSCKSQSVRVAGRTGCWNTRCDIPLYRGTKPYMLQVPEQRVRCPIIVYDPNPSIEEQEDEVEEAEAPSLTATPGACIIGAETAIGFRAVDPQNEPVRYLIDWDNDGTIDQYVPMGGYYSSGSTAIVTRTYATAGTKVVRAFAEDEGGARSLAFTTSFTCLSENPSPDGTLIIIDDDNTNTAGDGIDLVGLVDIRAEPIIVHPGGTSMISWSADEILTGCAITDHKSIDVWEGIAYESPAGGRETSAITEQTMYTLSCLLNGDTTVSDSVVVNIAPVFEEF